MKQFVVSILIIKDNVDFIDSVVELFHRHFREGIISSKHSRFTRLVFSTIWKDAK
jgi:hypothetical protein